MDDSSVLLLKLLQSFAFVQAHHSSQSLFAFLKGIQKDIEALTQFTQTLLRIFKNNLQNDRYIKLNQIHLCSVTLKHFFSWH